MPRKILLISSLTLNAAIVLFFIGKRIYWTHLKNPTEYRYSVADYMTAATDMQSRFPVDSNSIVFVGNSLTSNFPLNEFFPGLPVKNRGIGSNHTIHILERIQGIANGKPRMIFLEAGINDFAAGRSVDSVFLVYRGIIYKIREASPGTRIIIQSTTPVRGTSAALMPQIDQFNNLLREYSVRQGFEYLDINSSLRKGELLDSAYTWDGIHLNYEGYKVWVQSVKRLILAAAMP